jgi:hypothetical protein
MSRRRLLLVVAAAALAVLALVGIGRWEGAHRADEQMAGMRRVLAEVGPLDSSSLSAFRYLSKFQCLVYERGSNPLALEVCVDADGRVVEAIDRRSGDPKIWSLREEPSRSTVRVDRAEVDRLLRKMGVPQRLIVEAHREGGS